MYYTKKCITFKWCLSHRFSFIEPLLIIVTTCTSRNIDTWSLKFKITRSVTCLDLQLELDSGDQLRTKLYDKRDDLNFPIMNCSYLCSSFPSAARASGIYISQLIRDSKARGSYQDFLDRGLLLARKLLNQGSLLVKMKSSLFVHHHDWLGWPLWDICVTNDHGNVPPIVNTSQAFPHSWLIIWSVTR